MDRDDRKQAADAWKERQAQPGIYAVRCGPAGAIWIGQTGDLAKIGNRIRFMLRHGGAPAPLAAACRAHGEDSFVIETLEALDADLPAFALRALSRERLGYWRQVLAAALL